MTSKSLANTWDRSPSQQSPVKCNSNRNKQKDIDVFNSTPQYGRQPPKPLEKLKCIICLHEKAAGKVMKCEHEVMCLKCAELTIISSIQMQKMPKCPLNCCQATLSTASDSIYSKLSTKAHLLWKAFDLKSQIDHLGPTHKCQKPDCPGFLNPFTSTCQICEHKHCSKCNRLDHQGECLGISANIAGMQDLKFCKFCVSKISKEGGCSRITCPTCKKQICFECLDEWSISHHGCAEYGWLMLPFHFFKEKCCSTDTVSKNTQIIIEGPKYRRQD